MPLNKNIICKRKAQEGVIMNKIWRKICGGMLVAALAVSSFTGTALADEVTNTAEVQEDNLATGAYTVDITWSPMASMFTPIVEIDAEADTFKVYNATAPETSKGTGTISFADGVYTMTYTADVKEPGVTTTFTYDEEVITFTSKLYYGTASFDQTDDAGNFVTYTAEKTVLAAPEEDTNTENNGTTEDTNTENTGATEDTNNNETENTGAAEDTNNSETENNNTTEDTSSETEKEETSDVPKTADASNIGFLVAVGLAGAAVVMMGKKYENA